MGQTHQASAQVRAYKTASRAVHSAARIKASVFHGDCFDLTDHLEDNSVDLVVTSPPYCMGMEYERATTVEDFVAAHKRLLPEIVRITKPGGSICWQVGHHVSKQAVFPLDYAIFAILQDFDQVHLRNRIIWSFAHGLHGSARFSGRHETILWYTKGVDYRFDLDAVRVPQKYPGKRHYKGPYKGQLSGNPLGKNPGDVWEIPNVKGNHVEKTEHPCQFPVALVQRLVRALSPAQGLVFDPFMGSGTSGVAAVQEGRRFLGAEIQQDYCAIALPRLRDAASGAAEFRPIDKPIMKPDPRSKLAITPAHFLMGHPSKVLPLSSARADGGKKGEFNSDTVLASDGT